MLLNFIFLFTSIFGFVILFLMGYKYKSNRITNIYLIIFFFLGSIRFLFYGFSFLPFCNQNVIYLDVLFNILAWPSLYLYFNNLISNRNDIRLKEMVHYIVPVAILIFYYLQFVFVFDTKHVVKIAFPLLISINCCYYYFSYQLLANSVWKRKSKIILIDSHFNMLRKWTKFLFGLLSLMFLRFLFNLLLNDKSFWYYNRNYYLWIAALLWIALFVKIVMTPEVLSGYHLLQRKFKGDDQNRVTLDYVWKKEALKIVVNVQDAVLKERLAATIQNYIIEIERISLNTNLFFSTDFTIVVLAHKLNMPQSHLFYIFKYHSRLSFSDFKKMIRIQKAIAMIEDGYLKTNTMEALALDVGFYSYSPFFKSFKLITGESPYEYQKIKNTTQKLLKVVG